MGKKNLPYSSACHLSICRVEKKWCPRRKFTDLKWLSSFVLIFEQPPFSESCHWVDSILPDWLKTRALGSKEMTAATQMPGKLLLVETLNNISEDSVFCDYKK